MCVSWNGPDRRSRSSASERWECPTCYGSSDEAESIATVQAAIDAGIDLIDTADFYGSGANEMLLQRALHDRDRDQVTISVKFGSRRDPAGGFQRSRPRPTRLRSRTDSPAVCVAPAPTISTSIGRRG